MTASLNADHPLIRAVFYGNLFFLMLAMYPWEWTNATVMLPWLLMLICPDARAKALQIVHSNKIMAFASIILSGLILTGCQFHACTSFGIDTAAIPLIWLPIAALNSSVQWRHHRSTIIMVLMLATCYIALTVIWQSIGEHRERPKGLSHNVLTAPMVLAMLCLIAALIRSSIYHNWRIALWITTTLGMAASILTNSKTGLLTFLVGIFIYLSIIPTARRKTLAIVSPVVIIWFTSLTTILKRIPQEYSGYSNNQYKTSLAERSDAIKWFYQHFMDAPLLGKGPLQLTYELSHRWKEWGRQEFEVLPMLHLHNDYFQMTVAYGIPAAICFIAIFVTLIRITWQSMRRTPLRSPPPLAETWILTLTGIFMTAFTTDSFTHWNNTWAMMIACVGLSLNVLDSTPSITMPN